MSFIPRQFNFPVWVSTLPFLQKEVVRRLAHISFWFCLLVPSVITLQALHWTERLLRKSCKHFMLDPSSSSPSDQKQSQRSPQALVLINLCLQPQVCPDVPNPSGTHLRVLAKGDPFKECHSCKEKGIQKMLWMEPLASAAALPGFSLWGLRSE